jgi:Ca2+-binding RTX toxin-like protein
VLRRFLDPRLIGKLIVLLAILVGAPKLYAAATAGSGSPLPRAQTLASGSMSVADSNDGSAIFSISSMAPGKADQGEVTIDNTGSAPGSLVLSSFNRLDSPGTYGGLISEVLDLRVVNVSGDSRREVYSGKLGSMPEQQLGTLAVGGSGSYRFIVSMPDGRSPPTPWAGDNVYQGASASIGYDWTLTEVAGDGGPLPADPVPPVPVPNTPVIPQSCSTLLSGGSDADQLIGTAVGDLIYGRGGADVILGLAGDDCAYGGSGDDSIYGGTGNDQLSGGGGADMINGGSGSDLMLARHGGVDSIRCGSGRDNAVVDRRDHVSGCEIVHRSGR